MAWKPISEYPTTPGQQGPVVLARTKDKEPILVCYLRGQFYVCPANYMYYGEMQSGFMTANHVTEFMEIPP